MSNGSSTPVTPTLPENESARNHAVDQIGGRDVACHVEVAVVPIEEQIRTRTRRDLADPGPHLAQIFALDRRPGVDAAATRESE
jgi:hypothetical protein